MLTSEYVVSKAGKAEFTMKKVRLCSKCADHQITKGNIFASGYFADGLRMGRCMNCRQEADA